MAQTHDALLRTQHHLELGSPRNWRGIIAGALRAMGQHVEQNGVSRVVTAVAVIVIASIILSAGGAGIAAYYSVGGLREHVDSGFCNLNQRLDYIQHVPQPRTCQ